MARRAASPTTLIARVRAHFGLSQAQMALYLGVSEPQAQHLESGRRALTAAVRPALLPLLPHLPATAGPGPVAGPLPALVPGSPAPEAAALRLRQCQQQADRLRAQALALAAQAQVAAYWATALPALLAAAATEAAEAAAAADAAGAARAAWRTGWLHRMARPLPSEAATRYHLLLARLAALEAEAAALAAVEPAGPG
ncbi:MAG: helix-turn-helix domain-containing protein [Janthinobacterium lividum]